MKCIFLPAFLCLLATNAAASDGMIVQIRTAQQSGTPTTQPAAAPSAETSLDVLAYPDKAFSSTLSTTTGTYHVEGLLHDLQQKDLYRVKLRFNLAGMGASTTIELPVNKPLAVASLGMPGQQTQIILTLKPAEK
jgi:hypothetical protein